MQYSINTGSARRTWKGYNGLSRLLSWRNIYTFYSYRKSRLIRSNLKAKRKGLRKLSLFFSQKLIKIVASLVLKNLASGHFYLSIYEKCGQKSGLVARKSGQLATFENKCGHKNLRKMAKMTRKMGQNGLKMAFFGHF